MTTRETDFDRHKAIYYLESIARNLKEFADVCSDMPTLPSIGSEIMADNRDWLDCYITKLRDMDGENTTAKEG